MIRSVTCIVILLLSTLKVWGQSYSYDDVIKKAGIALKQVLPSHLIPATSIRTPPYYLSLTPNEEWLLLENGKRTKGKLQKIKIRYKLLLRHTTCSNFSNVEATIELELNNKLEVVSHKGTNEIPEYVLRNLPCPLLSPAEIVSIAAKAGVNLTEQSLKPHYNSHTRKFTYSDHTILTPKGEFNPDSPKKVRIGLLRIDGETGEVLENTVMEGRTK